MHFCDLSKALLPNKLTIFLYVKVKTFEKVNLLSFMNFFSWNNSLPLRRKMHVRKFSCLKVHTLPHTNIYVYFINAYSFQKILSIFLSQKVFFLEQTHPQSDGPLPKGLPLTVLLSNTCQLQLTSTSLSFNPYICIIYPSLRKPQMHLCYNLPRCCYSSG